MREGKFLCNLIKKIINQNGIESCKRRVLIPLCTEVEDLQACSYNRSIKVMSRTIMVWRRMSELILREEANMTEELFSLIAGRETIDIVLVMRKLMKLTLFLWS